MPAESLVPSADGPQTHRHDALPESETERDILDEDSLREDQPYTDLEETPSTYGPRGDDQPEGAGSW